jgi:hypothetical protein
MKTSPLIVLFGLLALTTHLSAAPLGTAFTYQGRLTDGPNPANGIYHFMFELFDAPTGGTLLNDNEREDVTVSNGLFTVVLDFGATAFTGNARWLQAKVQTNSGGGFTILNPRQQLYPAPYALMAASVPRFLTLGAPDSAGQLSIYSDNAPLAIRLEGDPPGIRLFGSDGLENLRVSGPFNGGEIVLFDNLTNDMTVRLSSGAGVPIESGGLLELFSTSVPLSASHVRARLSSGFNFGQLDLFGSSASPAGSFSGNLLRLNYSSGDPAADLSSFSGIVPSLKLYGTDGLERVRLGGTNAFGPLVGELRLYDDVGHNDTVVLTATTNSGGLLELRNASGGPSLSANGEFGQLTLHRPSDGAEQVRLLHFGSGILQLFDNLNHDNTVVLSAGGDGGGFLNLNSSNGQARAVLTGANAGGNLRLNNGAGALSVDVRSQFGAGNTAAWVGLNDNGSQRITFAARNGSTGTGGLIGLFNGSGAATVLVTGDNGSGHSKISMFNASGVEKIQLHANHTSGKGRIVTDVLEITAGADLSEQFDVSSPDPEVHPGMVVCIDPQNPGKLILSAKAYDRTVAGIVSGAGGVSPGMLMGQQGTPASGKHPIALTGRVYCQADASNGSIQPGDLLTSSDTPGHSMKVTDHAKAQGAIIGKAMTALESGKGLVLVLVSLQ